jgi:hypothetical protein
MGTIKPYHQEMVEARARFGEFELVWGRSGDIEVMYLDMLISTVQGNGRLQRAIEDNGKRTIELLEEEFVTLLSEV